MIGSDAIIVLPSEPIIQFRNFRLVVDELLLKGTISVIGNTDTVSRDSQRDSGLLTVQCFPNVVEKYSMLLGQIIHTLLFLTKV